VEPNYTDPSQIGESDTISEAYPNSFLEVKCKIEPELLIENLANDDILPETVFKPEPKNLSKPASKRTGRKRKGQTVRLTPNDEPELFKSLIDPYECSFCTKRFRLHSKLTKHLKQHRSDVMPEQKTTARNPSCPICQQVMASKYCLKRHLINSHYLYSTYRCHHCSEFKSLTKARMEEHLQLWHFETEQACPDCSNVLPNRRAYLKHIKEHQTGKLQCPGCKRSFTKPAQYRTHLKINKTVIHCKQCNAGFHSVRARDVHMQTLHGLVFTCDVCKKPLSNRLNYNSHLRIQHSIHVKPCCKICAKEFEYTEEMVAHEMSEHATRNYICETCGQNFMDKSTMLKHITARHTDDEKVVKENCRVCGKLLKKDSMRNHIRKMHTENRVRKMPKLVYTCPQCPQWKFSRHQHLEGHMIVHNTENRQFFQCSSCGIAYTRRQKFDIHVKKCLIV
jgi:Zinc-finger of C2H2 type/Zinc finger, C2H2 type